MSKHEINAIDLEVHFQVSEPDWLLFLHLDTAIRSHLGISSVEWGLEIHPGMKDEEGRCTGFNMRICPRDPDDGVFLSKTQRNKLFDLIFGSFPCTKVDGLAHTYQREREHGEEPLQESYRFMSLEEYHWSIDDHLIGRPHTMRIWRLPDCILDRLDSRWENSYMASECSYMVLACGQMAHLDTQSVEVLPFVPEWYTKAKKTHQKQAEHDQQLVKDIMVEVNNIVQSLSDKIQELDKKIEKAGSDAADSGKESK